ncbi:Holliday junction branch migration protein RuvA [Pontibaca methylaminivorans]|uniref:Holliday junction branch migration complex subunit RuvA n=1 Tax=Pontibaca methylaminivorans TaxID=515897 RepID=A0A1R3X8B0_9RHOB|nr:Holliday junction branch migration protein RuvA [Pontibaca methylaminivorans]SIT86944.1 Holliday junction DNA helicase subunit RuvA [Pontibaca methylaminivorans]
MIGRIRGRLDWRGGDHVLIDVGGVGYIVHCSERTLAALPAVGEAVSLYTDLVVREDLLQLIGFPSLVEKEWYRLLTTVQGVGAKVALAILGAIGAEGLGRAIALGDWAAVRVARGVGPKTAQRIVLELKDKAPAVMAMGTAAEPPAPSAAPTTDDETVTPPPSGGEAAAGGQGRASAQADALSALGNLGYGPSEAAAAVAQAAGETPEAGAEALIRQALKLLAPKA